MPDPVKADLTGRKAIVTGANTGIGKAIARELARLGAEVTLACRNADKGEAARADIAAGLPKARIEVRHLDLASLASVGEFAARFLAEQPKLDILVNNAGLWGPDRTESVDGIELQWATNVLGPQQLTLLLLPALKASGHGRVVNVASTAAGGLDLDDVEFKRRKYDGFKAYSATKQANRMLTWALAEKLKGSPVTANALSPGLVKTELNRNVRGFLAVVFKLAGPMQRTVEQGADTAVWLAASPEVEGRTNTFWIDRKAVPCKFRNESAQARLWALCDAQLAGRRAA